MNSAELKELQAPIKEKYKAEPESAMITLRAEGKIGEGISCKVETGRAIIEAGLHPATGGTGMLACSGDLLLEALVACAGVTLRAVSTAIGMDIPDGMVKAEGDLDFRGTLGVSKEAPVGFKSIRLSFALKTNARAEQMESLAKLTERYCVVYQTLTKGVPVETRYSIEQ
ncbi:MAG TPA: OsmC family protein [Puia sp.]